MAQPRAAASLSSQAREHGVSAKTIQRDLSLIRELGHASWQRRAQGDGPGNQGAEHRHWYADRRHRLFAR